VPAGAALLLAGARRLVGKPRRARRARRLAAVGALGAAIAAFGLLVRR
jgi:hypothetical protein